MPRPVKERVSYRDDAAFMIRLEKACERDERQTPDWKKKASDLLKQLQQLLLAANTPPLTDSAGHRNGGKNKK